MNATSVGVDVSKGKSMVAVLRPFGELVAGPKEVLHTCTGLEKLVCFLSGLDGEVRVIMEATGRYHEPIATALHESGIFVSVVNPKLIKDYGNNSLRKVKTDKADAVKIARYGLEYWGNLRKYTSVDMVRVKMKEFSRQYNLYTKTKVALKNNLIALLDQTFPNANTLFDSPPKKDGHQKWVDFVIRFWHNKCISDLTEAKFMEQYRSWCKRNHYQFTDAKAAVIHAKCLECATTLPRNNNTKLLITEAAAQLTAISRTAEVFRAELLRLAALLPEYPAVMGLYGVGDTTGPQLMAEIGDVRDFKNHKALVAFAGIDPALNQSGKQQTQSNPTTKRGSSHLRKTLFQTVSTYLKQSPPEEPVYQFLDKKRAEGKPFYVYMTASANKFLRIYYARVKEYLNELEQTDS